MRPEEFDYELPAERVAQRPAPRRDAARLLLLDRASGRLFEATFACLGEILRAGDLLVLNDTRVVQARLRARKPSGGRVELLLLRRDVASPEGGTWDCLLSTSKGMQPGTRLEVAADLVAEVAQAPSGGRALLRFTPADHLEAAIRRHGLMPLPPYIHRLPQEALEELDRERYQTVYAAHDGAIAAPTAGLHFTMALLEDLRRRGVEQAALTLHVGPGTFQPVRSPTIEEHIVEPERYRLPAASVEAIEACRARGGRVVAVGTTVTRVLEACAAEDGRLRAGGGWCGLYLRPGHRFRVVDALLTNLHLPRSSLLILVAAFAGRERILKAYGEAVRRGFRFYSYGDAMLIL